MWRVIENILGGWFWNLPNPCPWCVAAVLLALHMADCASLLLTYVCMRLCLM